LPSSSFARQTLILPDYAILQLINAALKLCVKHNFTEIQQRLRTALGRAHPPQGASLHAVQALFLPDADMKLRRPTIAPTIAAIVPISWWNRPQYLLCLLYLPRLACLLLLPDFLPRRSDSPSSWRLRSTQAGRPRLFYSTNSRRASSWSQCDAALSDASSWPHAAR